MYLQRLRLTNFRLYESLELEFPRGLIVLIGPNASGKTSLLEAIYLLATTKSPRTNNEAELIRWGADTARIEGLFQRPEGAPLQLAIAWARRSGGACERRLEKSGEAVSSPQEFIGCAPVVLFSPDDLALIKGGPEQRRRFLNTALGALDPTYLEALARYRHILRQRNELLRRLADGEKPPPEARAWTEQFVQAAAALTVRRQHFLGQLEAAAHEIHQLLAPGEQLTLRYVSEAADCPDEAAARERLAARLRELEDLEVRRGLTLVGPHRDDVEICLNEAPARHFGSQGQQRTAALSLKLAQARVAEQWRAEPPLLLLDDCLSELDPARARAVLALEEHLDGLFVTSAKPDPALEERAPAALYQLHSGTAERVL